MNHPPQMKSLSSFIVFSFFYYSAFAQIQQSVNGKVVDAFSKPLTGANVQLIGTDSVYQQSTNQDGDFLFSVIPGRYRIRVTFTGFEKAEEELLVIAGKVSQVRIALTEQAVQLKDVEITSGQGNAESQGGYSISIEKTMRVPANFFDPVRMATSLPGVVATNDQSNSISVKGYSPNALLWRLQGLDIVNPNHLANAGTLSDKPVANGGGVSILSSQVLDRTDFYSGSLPVQYGNALSGAMDMSLRPGSKRTREHTVQASLIGIDLATEGPMGKVANGPSGGANSKSSYLVNYRYSTVGLLSLAGVNFGDEKINFQDLTFHLDFGLPKNKHLSVFGFGGLSDNQFDRKPDAEWKTEKDRYDIDFKGQVFGAGFMSTLLAQEKSNLKVGVAVSGQYQSRKSQSQQINPSPSFPNYVFLENYQSDRTLVSAKLSFSQRIAPSTNFMAGAVATSIHHLMDVETVTPLYFDSYFPNVAGTVSGILWQPYISTSWKTKLATIVGGVRYVYFGYNASTSLEPRINITTPIFKGQLIAAYGVTSQIQQTQTYIASSNSALGQTRAHQFSASYQRNFEPGFSVRGNAYYHKLFDVPVSALAIPFSIVNQTDDFVPMDLSPAGLGRNKGLEVSVEKKFVNQLYFLAGGSWYGSGYSNGSSTFYTSRYNGKFTYSFSGGKEWSRRKNKTFGLHSRMLYLGGLRQQAIDVNASREFGTTVFVNENIFDVQLPDYFRLDLRVSWRKNKPNYTRTISLDIQNLTNQQNTAYRYYDTFLQTVETKYQLGLIPVLVYRVDF
jgi:Carboxypeptidase regulatory-like domain